MMSDTSSDGSEQHKLVAISRPGGEASVVEEHQTVLPGTVIQETPPNSAAEDEKELSLLQESSTSSNSKLNTEVVVPAGSNSLSGDRVPRAPPEARPSAAPAADDEAGTLTPAAVVSSSSSSSSSNNKSSKNSKSNSNSRSDERTKVSSDSHGKIPKVGPPRRTGSIRSVNSSENDTDVDLLSFAGFSVADSDDNTDDRRSVGTMGGGAAAASGIKLPTDPRLRATVLRGMQLESAISNAFKYDFDDEPSSPATSRAAAAAAGIQQMAAPVTPSADASISGQAGSITVSSSSPAAPQAQPQEDTAGNEDAAPSPLGPRDAQKGWKLPACAVWCIDFFYTRMYADASWNDEFSDFRLLSRRVFAVVAFFYAPVMIGLASHWLNLVWSEHDDGGAFITESSLLNSSSRNSNNSSSHDKNDGHHTDEFLMAIPHLVGAIFGVFSVYIYMRVSKQAPLWAFVIWVLLLTFATAVPTLGFPRYTMGSQGCVLLAQSAVLCIGSPRHFVPVVIIISLMYLVSCSQVSHAALLERAMRLGAANESEAAVSRAVEAARHVITGKLGPLLQPYHEGAATELFYCVAMGLGSGAGLVLCLKLFEFEFNKLVIRSLALHAVGQRMAKALMNWQFARAAELVNDDEQLLGIVQEGVAAAIAAEMDTRNAAAPPEIGGGSGGATTSGSTGTSTSDRTPSSNDDSGESGGEEGEQQDATAAMAARNNKKKKKIKFQGSKGHANTAASAAGIRIRSSAQALPRFLRAIINTINDYSRFVPQDILHAIRHRMSKAELLQQQQQQQFAGAELSWEGSGAPPAAAAAAAAGPSSSIHNFLRLPLRKVPATCLRLEIANFCALSESFDEARFGQLLCGLHTRMIQIVMDLNGTVVQCCGSTLIAVWGSIPKGSESMEALACTAALEMLGFVQDEQAPRFAAVGWKSLRVRIGIHRGPCIFGNVGSDDQQVFTAMGEAVLGAQMLTELNKRYSMSSIIISMDTIDQAQRAFSALGYNKFDFATRQLGCVRPSSHLAAHIGRVVQLLGFIPKNLFMSDSLATSICSESPTSTAGLSMASDDDGVMPLLDTPIYALLSMDDGDGAGQRQQQQHGGGGDSRGGSPLSPLYQIRGALRGRFDSALLYAQRRFSITHETSVEMVRLLNTARQYYEMGMFRDAELTYDQAITPLDQNWHAALVSQGIDEAELTALRDECAALHRNPTLRFDPLIDVV